MRCSLLAVLLGCGAHALPPPAHSPEDALEGSLVELTSQMEVLGFARRVFERRFLLPGGSFAYPVLLPAGECRTWTVLSSSGLRDVDATLYTADGLALAQDVESDAHPTIQSCAMLATRLYLHLSVYEGAGELYLVEFASTEPVDVTSVVGGRPGTTIVGEETAESELLTALRGRRFRSSEPPREIDLPSVSEETSVEIIAPIRVHAGRCYAVVAVSADPVALRVRRESALLAREGSGLTSATQWCADASGPVDVAVIGKPSARVRLWIFEVEEARVGGASGLWLGQRP